MVSGGILRHGARPHGSREVIVRGTVVDILPGGRKPEWFKYLKPSMPPEVRITIDAAPYAKLQQLLQRGTSGGGVTQTFGIGWNLLREIPKKGDRVWVTFGYAADFEQFFHGAPRVSFKGIEVIPEEWHTKEGELVEEQPSLFPGAA